MYFGETKRIYPNNTQDSAWTPHGYGEFHYDGSIKYEGEFKNGRMFGQGKYDFHLDDSSYMGTFYNSNMEGTGVMVTPEGRSIVLMRDNAVICTRDGNSF